MANSSLSSALLRLLFFSFVFLVAVEAVFAQVAQNESDENESADYKDEDVLKAFSMSLPDLLKITVTAQKREQSIQEVPIAVSSIWEAQLEQLRIFDALELSFHVPGFSAGQFNVGQPQYYIRGIGSNEDGAGGDNAVVVTVDGVPVSRAAGSLFDYFDVERIEVLRGPQGTLYGRNASGGVINVISHLPLEDKQVIEAGLGTSGVLSSRFYFSGALDDNQDTLASISFSHRQRDGTVESVYGPELSDVNDTGLKAQLYSSASEQTSWRLIAELGKVDRAGPGRHAVEGLIAAAVEGTHPEIVDDPYRNLSPFDGFQKRDLQSLTALVESELFGIPLNSVSGYRQSEIQSQIDQSGLSEAQGLLSNLLGFGLAGTNDVDETSWQFSQELRLSDNYVGGNWLAGAFYLREKTDRTEIFDYQLDSFSFQQNQTDSFALFGEVLVEFNPKISLTFGGRYSWEEKQVEQSGIGGLLAITQDYQVQAKKSWSQFTPRLVLNYSPHKSLHSYISFSSGFKSGGFQGQAPSALAAQTPFNEENVDSIEVGFKWYSPQSESRLHAALFKMAYDDLQVLQLVDNPDDPTGVGILITENAANATSQGIELEWEKIVSDNWLVFGNYSYLDATYDHFISANADFAGNRLRNAPKNAAAVAISYQTTVETHAQLNLTYSHSYQDIRYQDPANIENSALPSYQLGKLNLEYEPQKAGYKLGFWIDNIWNERYFIHGFPLLGSGMLTPAPKRTLGLKVAIEL